MADHGGSLLDVLREELGLRSPKDGCSPQGQCGCCTVLVDGQPRVACVTPARRVAGRSITTVDGLPADDRDRWADAFCASRRQPVRVLHAGDRVPARGPARQGSRAGRPRRRGAGAARPPVPLHRVAHDPRRVGPRHGRRAAIPSPPARRRGRAGEPRRRRGAGRRPGGALGQGGFADDTAPPRRAGGRCPTAAGGWVVGESLAEARALAGKVQGRRTTVDASPPLDLPPGDWAATLRTSWVEPAYLEPDASWCEPGGAPHSPLANGGAFGGKAASVVTAAARELADRHGRPVRVLLDREDVVRLGPKRPPVAGGADADGTGVLRVVRTDGHRRGHRARWRRSSWWRRSTCPARRRRRRCGPPGGPRPSCCSPARAARPARWSTRPPARPPRPRSPPDGDVRVRVRAGDPLDEVVLRSYCTGAAHMALSWMSSEGIAVDDDGRAARPHDPLVRRPAGRRHPAHRHRDRTGRRSPGPGVGRRLRGGGGRRVAPRRLPDRLADRHPLAMTVGFHPIGDLDVPAAPREAGCHVQARRSVHAHRPRR